MQQKRESRKDSQVPKSDYANRRSSKVCAFWSLNTLGTEADKFLNDLSKKSVDAEGRSNEHALYGEGIFQFCYRDVIVQSFLKSYKIIMWEGSRLF